MAPLEQSKRIYNPENYHTVDTLEENNSIVSSSEFDEESISDSLHLAMNRGVPISRRNTLHQHGDKNDYRAVDNDDDCIELDSVHLTRRRIPQCIWRSESSTDELDFDDLDEFSYDVLLQDHISSNPNQQSITATNATKKTTTTITTTTTAKGSSTASLLQRRRRALTHQPHRRRSSHRRCSQRKSRRMVHPM